MLLIPAIDIMMGQCVRLVSGQPESAVVYGDPVEFAAKWIAQGASRLHVVDLDGAFSGSPQALEVLAEISRLSTNTQVQYGGGLRRMADIEAALSSGADYVIVGSALQEASMMQRVGSAFGERVIAAIDVKDGKALTKGWTSKAHSVAHSVQNALAAGVEMAIVTSISNDGTFLGPDVTTAVEVADMGMRVIVSGGIGELEHLRLVQQADCPQIAGVVLGKALYESRFSLAEARSALLHEGDD